MIRVVEVIYKVVGASFEQTGNQASGIGDFGPKNWKPNALHSILTCNENRRQGAWCECLGWGICGLCGVGGQG